MSIFVLGMANKIITLISYNIYLLTTPQAADSSLNCRRNTYKQTKGLLPSKLYNNVNR